MCALFHLSSPSSEDVKVFNLNLEIPGNPSVMDGLLLYFLNF